jgi:hypothetical protein
VLAPGREPVFLILSLDQRRRFLLAYSEQNQRY